MPLAGRGWGKTRTGTEWVLARVRAGAKSIALCGRTPQDVRDTMIEGESGILRCSPPWDRPKWQPSLCALTWKNGARAITYSAEKPDKLRGPNTDTVWGDELASWSHPDAWTQLTLVLRSMASRLRPQAMVTTTPRPTDLVRSLVKNPMTRVTRGSTYDNAANLAPAFLAKLEGLYGGTRIGRQELFAELLLDASGALWRRDQIDRDRVSADNDTIRSLNLQRIVIAVDPAMTSGEDSDETGIIVAGIGEPFEREHGIYAGPRGLHGYVLEDASGKFTPLEWSHKVAQLYQQYQANAVIVEVNQGGDLVESNLRAAKIDLPITKIHASKGKRTRAEPVATLYEQHRVHHVGALENPKVGEDDDRCPLETQLCTWEPENVEGDKRTTQRSPDRLDALVYALTDLMVDTGPSPPLADFDPYRPSA
jgi:phage terminase large subunit-like protein